jgi:hypothetical protein
MILQDEEEEPLNRRAPGLQAQHFGGCSVHTKSQFAGQHSSALLMYHGLWCWCYACRTKRRSR